MAMFGVAGRETYDALYSVLNQPADTDLIEREQAPDTFAGMGEAAQLGTYRGLSRGAASLANVATPFVTPVAKSIDEIFGSSTEEWLRGETEKANRALLYESKIDPKTVGAAGQILYGLSDVLTTVVSTGGNPYATGALYGLTQAQIGVSEGLDPMTAFGKGAIEGVTMGVSVAIPAALSGSLAFRAATGAGINVGIGVPERFAVSSLLNARGYPEMARQYEALDSTAIITELVLGATFGGLLGPRGRAPKLPPPEAIPPSAVDAALVANRAKHAEIDTAPGIPTDTRSRQAHNDALNSAVESLVMGREVSVERILAEAGFVGKRTDFDALRVITDELEKAGAADIVAQVRALEADARARGLVVDEDTIGSVVLSDKPVETVMTRLAEREATPIRIGEDRVPARMMLVEADEVQATMMKADNQFRDRTRVASEQQIADIAARLDAALLMDAPVMDYGAPVLAADGTVIGGNGRAAAIGLAYERGTAQGYRDALREQFGDAVDGMQKPMIVRVLQRDVDVQKAAILSNEGGALRMSALEQAKVDAERLGDFRAFEFSEDGDVNLAANMPFIREWVGQMPQNQRASIMDADGRLSAEGAGRLRNAILYKAYGDSPTLARLVEATDPGSRNIAAALTRAAPAVADAREAIARGELYPLGLHDDLISAVEKLDALRRTGMSVDDWMKQIDAFGDGMTAEARLLVQFMDRNIRASRAISEGIFGYYNRLNEAGNPNQGSMFEAAQPDKMAMLTRALDEPAPMYGRGAGLRSNVADLTAALRSMFGRDADRLLETGRVRMVQSVKDLPGGPHPDDVGGMYWRGEAWLVADNTGLSQVRGRVLHEVGEHAGMEQMLGADLYRQVLDTVRLKAETDPVFREARALAEARANRPEHVDAETLAYLVENAPELPVVRRILAAVRQWLYRTTGGRFVDLNQADLQMMAVASLRRYAREAEIAEKGGDAPWYMTLFHGTPNPFKPEADAPLGRLQWRFINTGEGAQAFGYGHYLAQQEWVARSRYRDRLVERKAKDAKMTLVSDSVAANIRAGLPEDLQPAFDLAVQMIRNGSDKAAAWRAASESVGATLLSDPRVGAMDDALGRLNADGTVEISSRNDPAWKIGDRIVHEQMGGEEQGFAMAAAQVSSFGYARAKQTFENALAMSRTELAAQEASVARRIGTFKGDTAEAEQAMLKRGLEYQRNLVAVNEMAVRALDEVTVPGPVENGIVAGQDYFPAIKASIQKEANGSFTFFETGFGNRTFQTRDEAMAFAAERNRVLNPEIKEVRPKPPKGALYGKFIPDETWNQMMIWDAPYSAQPANVKAAIDRISTLVGLKETDSWDPDVVAAYIYGKFGVHYKLGDMADDDLLIQADMEIRSRRAPEGTDPADLDYTPNYEEVVSVMFNLLGVPGHRFLDGETRAKGWDDPDAKFNVVLYSDDLGRVAWEAKESDAEWVTANGRGRIYWKADAVDAADGGRAAAYMIEVDGKEAGSAATIEEATRLAEQALEGQLYSRTGDGANMREPDPLEDTTLPAARVLSDQADAEIATAQELSQGFLPAAECFLRAGE